MLPKSVLKLFCFWILLNGTLAKANTWGRRGKVLEGEGLLWEAGAPPLPEQETKSFFRTRKTHHGLGIHEIFQWYLRQCSENPVPTKSLTAAAISAISDVFAQSLSWENASESFLDIPRTGAFLLCGLFFVGPYVHYYYHILAGVGAWANKKHEASRLQQLLLQLSIDQTVGVSIYFPCYIFVFELFESVARWRQPSLDRPMTTILEDFFYLMMMQYRVYPIANAVNLTFIPPQLRVLYSNIVSFFWNIFLSKLLTK